MDLRRYELQWSFTGHTQPINVLKFSEDGTELASGADDGHIRIWSLTAGKLKQIIKPKQGPISCLLWFSFPQAPRDSYIMSGGADGTIKMWQKFESADSVEFVFSTMITVYDGCIESMSMNNAQSLLAVVGLGRLTLYAMDINQIVPLREILSEPPQAEAPRPALARCVHFFDEDRAIMVAFLDSKEIIAWKIAPWKKCWYVKLHSRIGNTSWWPATRSLLVSNLVDGVDIYRITDRPTFIRKLPVRITRNYTKQVHFGWNGALAVCGSDRGEVYLWEVESGTPHQVLVHGGETELIQAVSCCSPSKKKHMLASGSTDAGNCRPSIKVWVASTTSSHITPKDIKVIDNSTTSTRRVPTTTMNVWIRYHIFCRLCIEKHVELDDACPNCGHKPLSKNSLKVIYVTGNEDTIDTKMMEIAMQASIGSKSSQGGTSLEDLKARRATLETERMGNTRIIDNLQSQLEASRVLEQEAHTQQTNLDRTLQELRVKHSQLQEALEGTKNQVYFNQYPTSTIVFSFIL
ncbi:hypothetical protein SERLADRAFT_433992 [Serpula lacrymans var. lacrymans S7.9]|uniref:Uncharacterized protein n=1 Tax=Serpula lacrymans var. lacrymans (strain S7.9) TaxID=578457 RepID=F8NL94_SERL9|nr:uncharacterized protein SERLADRAFT_433992 [Serpula lacrymans var. lacrymans S7.9]EGO28142.1 hypothetical protein SERLADRAFT_433992 [Serpula lacrymans var. lacrymans S7.9]